MPFSSLGFTPELLPLLQRALQEKGYAAPTLIQAQAIPLILQGNDLVASAQTGSGKTAAFVLPLLQQFALSSPKPPRRVRSLVLVPTRELAAQVGETFNQLAGYLPRRIKVAVVFGGVSINPQMIDLRWGADVVVATPGRLLDLVENNALSLAHVNTLVLDEADRLLDLGFGEELGRVLALLPGRRQTLLFSATFPPAIEALTNTLLQAPHRIEVEITPLAAPDIRQRAIEVDPGQRTQLLRHLLQVESWSRALVFVATKHAAEIVAEKLCKAGMAAEALHGEMSQGRRTRVLHGFKQQQVQVLVATDVAARGIDVDDIEMVFNFDIPQDEEYYVHRIGRTGRAGRSGRAFSFVSGRNDYYELREIMRYANVKIALEHMPSQDDVEESKLVKLADQLRVMLAAGGYERYARTVEQVMGEDYTALDVAAVLLSMQTGTDLAAAAKEAAIELPEPDANGMVRLQFSVGREHGVTARDLVGAIAGESGISGRAIGAIDIYGSNSCVEVPAEQAREVISIMRSVPIRGQQVTVEPTRSRDREAGRVGGRGSDRGSERSGGGGYDRGGDRYAGRSGSKSGGYRSGGRNEGGYRSGGHRGA